MTSEEKIIKDINEVGWHAINVFEGDNNWQYTYTIGLMKSLNCPEMFISGLNGDISYSLISDIVDDLNRGDLIKSEQYTDRYISGYPCYFHLVESGIDDYFAKAVWFYGSSKIQFLQCVWTDRYGKFPWESKISFQQDILFDTSTLNGPS